MPVKAPPPPRTETSLEPPRASGPQSAVPATGARRGPSRAAASVPWLGVVALVCVGIPVLAAALTGNLAIPHNDAWAMSRIAVTFARTGRIRLLGWNDMNLIGQVVMLGPLGGSLVVQQLTVALLSVVCLLCVHRLLTVSLSPRDALLGVLLLGLWPGWASLSTSFETDVPAFAATFAALLLGRRALRRDSLGWLLGAALVSLWAVSIREQAIAAPAAILIYGVRTRHSRQRLGARPLLLVAGVTGALLLGFELWRWGLPLGQDPAPTAGPVGFAGGLAAYGSRSYLTLALGLSPAVLLGAMRHRWTRRDLTGLGTGLVVVALALVLGGPVGRYLAPAGEYAQVLPGARVVIPAGVWSALLALAALSGTLLVPLAWAGRRSIDPLLALFTMLAAAETLLIGASGNGVWDRYLPVLLPGTVTLLLAPRVAGRRVSRPDGSGPRRRVPGNLRAGPTLLALVVLAAISASLTANAFAFDAARWHLAQRLARAGSPPARIDAGMEWDGWHSAHGMRYGRGRVAQPGGWELAFSRAPACVTLTSSPWPVGAGTARARWTPDGGLVYPTYLLAGRSRLYAYRTHAAGCGT